MIRYRNIKGIMAVFVSMLILCGCGKNLGKPATESQQISGCSSGISPTETQNPIFSTSNKTHKFSEFEISENVTAEEIRKKIGFPNEYSGSGNLFFVYYLEDGAKLYLQFEGTYSGKLWYASIIRDNKLIQLYPKIK